MKKYLLLFSIVFLALSLSAQSPFVGTWSGKSVKNGQHMGFKLAFARNGTFSMAYDLNPNEVSLRGNWAQKGDLLIFEGAGKTLQLKRIPGATKSNKKAFSLTFKLGSKTTIYQEFENQAGWGFFDWEKGGGAVVINHEEQ